jgi:hypothetical protein
MSVNFIIDIQLFNRDVTESGATADSRHGGEETEGGETTPGW